MMKGYSSYKDHLLVEKMYEVKNLYGTTYESYHHFIDKRIDEILAEASSKTLYRVRVGDQDQTYHLTFGKAKIRCKKDLQTLYSKAFRQVKGYASLQVPVGIVKRYKGQQQALVKPKPYRLCQIPLLYNSRYDDTPGASESRYPYFLLGGTVKILVNQIVHSGTVPKIVTKMANGVVQKLTYSAVRNRLLEEYVYQYPKLTVSRGGYKGDFFRILRFLGVTIPEILEGRPDLNLRALALAEMAYAKETESQNLQKIADALGWQTQEGIPQKASVQEKLLATLGYRHIDQARFAMKDRVHSLLELTEGGKDPTLFVDHMMYKRILPCGATLAKAFSEGVDQLLLRMKTPLIKSIPTLAKNNRLIHLIRPEIITRALRKTILTSTSDDSEPLNRPIDTSNMIDAVAQLRKIVTPLNKNLSHDQYRQFNPSEVGRVCPAHTPHSRSTGLVESLAMGAKISKPFSDGEDAQLKSLIANLKLLTTRGSSANCRVYKDGEFLGYCSQTPEKIATYFRNNRKNLDLGVAVRKQSVQLATSPGRILKLLLVVKNGTIPYYELSPEVISQNTLTKLITRKLVRFVDAEEELSCRVALKLDECGPRDDYYYPGGILSYSYSMGYIPAANNNTGTRASLTLRFVAQALSEHAQTPHPDLNPRSQHLVRAQPSLLCTPQQALYGESLGQNILTAISSYRDYTCEDAVVVNKQAIERGMMDYIVYHRDKVRLYPDEKGVYHLSTQNFASGLPSLGSRIERGQALLSTVNPEGKRHSEIVSPGKEYRLQQVTLGRIKKDIKIMMTSKDYRNLTIGQKVGTRQGQKGVVGGIINQCNLPYSSRGHTPGLLVSPNVFNSRMTIGPLSEMLLAKSAAVKGQRMNQKVIEQNCLEPLTHASNILQSKGYHRDGYEDTLRYGCKNNEVYMGFLKVLLLQHHARDKCHRRRRGAIDSLTRQPSSGGKRSRGGLRFGQMERDAALAHGAPHLLNERLTPDSTDVRVCNSCHAVINEDHRQEGADSCGMCGMTDIVSVNVPYAFLVLTRTLRGASIQTCLVPQDNENDTNAEEDIPFTIQEDDER